MSDQVQLPPSLPFAPRVTPARAPDPIEPPKKSQADNRNANDHHAGGDAPPQAGPTPSSDRQLTITPEPALQSFVYRSIDADSGDVVWQWPAEQVLRRARLLRALEEKLQSELDETA